MSFDALCTTACEVWERTQESDSWTRTNSTPVYIANTPISGETARRESRDLQTLPTHRARCRPNALLSEKVVLTDEDGNEYRVLNIRSHTRRGLGVSLLLLEAGSFGVLT